MFRSQSHEVITPRASTYESDIGSLSSPVEPATPAVTAIEKERKKGGLIRL
jgi:hypothetical protein